MPTTTTINYNTPIFSLGELVVIKSYPTENPITGDPLSLPPIMVVTGIEIENRKKKTHDNHHGKQIAERIKYKLVWFDAKNSSFTEKIMYESFLKKYEVEENEVIPKLNYEYSELAQFKTLRFELQVKKKSKSTRITSEIVSKKTKKEEKEITTISTILPFVSPIFVMTSMKLNEEKNKFDDKGKATSIVPKRLIKIMWYNAQQSKYSEYEIAENCLINK